MPAKMISSGVIREPPPIPVIPISTPTPRPKTMINGSMGARLRLAVQAALGLVLPRPASLASRPGLRAGRASDRVVAPVVQRVVRQLVLGDEAPHVAVGPVGKR